MTSGVFKSNKSHNLSISGVFADEQSTTLHIGYLKHNDSTSATVYGNVPSNGATTLSFVSPIASDTGSMPLHIGTQYDVFNNNTTLHITVPTGFNNNTTLKTEGSINFANSLTHGEGNYTVPRNQNIRDISEISELPVTLDFNESQTVSNSITRRILGNSTVYPLKAVSPSNDSYFSYFGAREQYVQENVNVGGTNVTYRNLALLAKPHDFWTFGAGANTPTTLAGLRNLMQREAFDANGKHMVIANNEFDKSASVDVYDIVNSDNIEFASKIKIDLHSPTSTPEDPSYIDGNAEYGSATSPFGDSFVDMRKAIRAIVGSGFSEAHCIIKDLKISKLGVIAISLSTRFTSQTDLSAYYLDIIIIFRTTDIKSGISRINGKTTYYVDDYSYHIYDLDNWDQFTAPDVKLVGRNLEFAGEDLYFDSAGMYDLGRIMKLSPTDNYASEQLVINFDQNPDAAYYLSANNLPYLPAKHRVGFGYPIKIYDDYYSSGRIMFVGATAFDPYVFNTLTAPHNPSPVGAVYIYKQSRYSSEWTYFGAVYGKGYTSDNVIANLSQYRDSNITPQYGFFGCDFDYSKGNLVVAEPGGSGASRVNTQKAYLFSINDSITLLETYTADDITLPDSSAISIYDQFAAKILLLDGDNPITYSDSDYGNGLIHSLKADNTIPSSLAYVASQADENIKNETYLYANPLILNYDDSLVDRSSVFSAMRLLDFGPNNKKLGVVRRFKTRLSTPANTAYNFDLDKFFIYDLRQEPFSLFISGPTGASNNIPAVIASYQSSNNSADLFIPVIGYGSGDMSLFLEQKQTAGDLSLIVKNALTNTLDLHVSGQPLDNDGSTSLQITAGPAGTMNLVVNVIDRPSQGADLVIDGNTSGEIVATPTLFIGKDSDADLNTTLYIQGETAAAPDILDILLKTICIFAEKTPPISIPPTHSTREAHHLA